MTIRDRAPKKIKVSIDGVEINDTWLLINIWESIDSPTWSCDIDLMDSTNLLESIPILHGSKLKISIETMDGCSTDGSVEFIFFVYKIGNKVSANQNVETYKLNAVSKPFLANNTIRINKKYEDMKATDIIGDILFESFPDHTTEIATVSDNTIDILINNWSPFIAAAWTLKQTHKDNRADFMFFQSELNGFKIDSIESMYSDPKNRVSEIITYKIENTGTVNYYNIIKHEWDHVDVQQNLQNGYYKSTVTSYDFLNKKWDESVYTHGDDNKEDLKIAPQWKGALFGSAEKSVISFTPKIPNIFNNSTGYDDSNIWVPSRRAVLQRLDSERFSAQLRGSIGMYNWIGKHIYVDLPNNSEKSGEFYSRFRKGYYLITSMRHHLSPSMYLIDLELVKMRVEQ